MKRLLPLLLALLLSLTSCIVVQIDAPQATNTAQATEQVTNAPEETREQLPIVETEACCTSDPYTSVNVEEFYANYTPACCYQNAIYRTAHSLMSGSIAEQDQAPSLSTYQPRENGQLVRNTSAIYLNNGRTYCVLDAYGNEANRIYKDGAYVILEEVAAYVYAFGNVPANYVSGKNTSPASNPWGIYLRLNHSKFSGDTSKYPYEPVLPRISGCGGDLIYYEIDIGTTGTDCDPSYQITDYNNGTKITRGAARIVYVRFNTKNDAITDPNERYVFYTYNHYNDFQEYLNYEGGWGEIFGNITGGGKLSSKYEYNPTAYIPVARRSFSTRATVLSLWTVADAQQKRRAA